MNNVPSFEEFLATQSVQVPVISFVVNILLAALLAFILGKVYTRFGNALSNRRSFAGNFVLLTTTTMLIISIVKSSLALSLGLVGALSIVRFRSAIKEPEELAYLFLSIAVGLGFGADQRIITIVAFALIVGLIILKSVTKGSPETSNLYLTMSSKQTEKVALDRVVGILKVNCSSVDLRRFDENQEKVEATFLVEFENYDKLEKAKSELKSIDSSVTISFLDNKALQ